MATATTLIKLPDLPFPLDELFESAVFQGTVSIDYTDGVTSTTIFSVPESTEIVAIGVKVSTAFDAAVGLQISDTDGVLMEIEDLFTTSAGKNYRFQLIGKTSNGNITLDQVEPVGTLAAGAADILVLYSPRAGSKSRGIVKA